MLALIGTVFIASLLGSLHCVGMCGPLAILASSTSTGTHKNHRRFNLAPIVAYHGSRVVAYAIAGAIVGLLGAGIQHTGSWFGFQRLAARLAGGSMMVIGLLAIVRLTGGGSHAAMLPAWLQSRLARGHAWARQQPPVPRAAAIGLLTAILPCGWLYAFLIVAAGTARPVDGALVMAFFAAGSIPALAGLAMSMTMLIGRYRSIIPWCSAVLVTIVGAATLITRSNVHLESMADRNQPAIAANKSTSTDAGRTIDAQSRLAEPSARLTSLVQQIDQEKLPCCCKAGSGQCESDSHQ